jgi:hypothetical protein
MDVAIGLALQFIKDQYRHAKPIWRSTKGPTVENAGVPALSITIVGRRDARGAPDGIAVGVQGTLAHRGGSERPDLDPISTRSRPDLPRAPEVMALVRGGSIECCVRMPGSSPSPRRWRSP